jgi:hypothetical protein
VSELAVHIYIDYVEANMNEQQIEDKVASDYINKGNVKVSKVSVQPGIVEMSYQIAVGFKYDHHALRVENFKLFFLHPIKGYDI